MTEIAIKLIADSSVLSILEYNLRNDSFFDVSEHIEIYQVLVFWSIRMQGALFTGSSWNCCKYGCHAWFGSVPREAVHIKREIHSQRTDT